MTGISSDFVVKGVVNTTNRVNTMAITSLAASTTVNALVTDLIVFRIFKVFREVKGVTTSDEKSLGVTGGEKLCPVIFVIIGSGMTLFAIQLAQLMLAALQLETEARYNPYALIVIIHQMLNVIISSVIVIFY